MEYADIIAIAGAAAFSTICALFWMLKSPNRSASHGVGAAEQGSAAISLLFDGDTLHHASDAALDAFQLLPGKDKWAVLRAQLASRFPDLPEHAAETSVGETMLRATSIEDVATLSMNRDGTFVRVNLQDSAQLEAPEQAQMDALRDELQNLQRASDTTTHAIWQEDQTGRVSWHNAPYRRLFHKIHQSEPADDKPVFALSEKFDEKHRRQRVSTEDASSGQKDWYDVTAAKVGDVTIYHAVDVNAVVKSEVAQRNFVQTLAKTFAQLSIGLAIFDRNGQLALFNPALIDLTELPADFLSGRPTLMSFFDRIRENRRMPEPKNYHSWRQEIAEVIAAATDGRYQETWTLETGQTYRVSGRPHPDGAIAFLIEDISAEISLTRNFRAELELGQSLMDSFEDGLVVFSSTGILTFSNLAYRQMWQVDPDNCFADVSISDCVSAWSGACLPDAHWAEVEEFVLDFGEKMSWDMQAKLLAGGDLTCSISRIASGATIIRFVKSTPLPTDKAVSISAARHV